MWRASHSGREEAPHLGSPQTGPCRGIPLSFGSLLGNGTLSGPPPSGGSGSKRHQVAGAAHRVDAGKPVAPAAGPTVRWRRPSRGRSLPAARRRRRPRSHPHPHPQPAPAPAPAPGPARPGPAPPRAGGAHRTRSPSPSRSRRLGRSGRPRGHRTGAPRRRGRRSESGCPRRSGPGYLRGGERSGRGRAEGRDRESGARVRGNGNWRGPRRMGRRGSWLRDPGLRQGHGPGGPGLTGRERAGHGWPGEGVLGWGHPGCGSRLPERAIGAEGAGSARGAGIESRGRCWLEWTRAGESRLPGQPPSGERRVGAELETRRPPRSRRRCAGGGGRSGGTLEQDVCTRGSEDPRACVRLEAALHPCWGRGDVPFALQSPGGTVQRGERLGLARPRARTRCSGPAPGGGTGDGDWVTPCLGRWSAQPGAPAAPRGAGKAKSLRCGLLHVPGADHSSWEPNWVG